jgi:HlyD family secretion protein
VAEFFIAVAVATTFFIELATAHVEHIAALIIGGLLGAVIAQGQVVVDSNVKKVQHPTGGIVGELRVRDGDHVKARDIVLRLDDTQTRANLAIIKALDELTARQAREEAERDGADTIDFPRDLLDRMDNPDVAKLVNGERKQFEVRRQAREGQKGQLRERITQSKEEIVGYTAQVASKDNQINWIKKELVGVNELLGKGLVPYTRVTALEREKERVDGERGQFTTAVAQAKGKITETELQILQVDQNTVINIRYGIAQFFSKIVNRAQFSKEC